MTMQDNVIVRTLGERYAIDKVAEPLQRVVHDSLEKVPVFQQALKGTVWLGHALHPALTDFPIGAWGAGFVLDMMEVFGAKRRLRYGADAVHAIGIGGAVLAAVTGLADWSETNPKARRIGFVHGLLNAGILGLYGASYAARRQKRRTTGIVLSSVGFGLLMFSGWLGRELTYSMGVAQTADRKRLVRRPLPTKAPVEPTREPGRYEIPTTTVEEHRPTTH